MSQTVELIPIEQPKKEETLPAERLKAAEMPVLRRSVEELAEEQKACNLILNQILGTGSLLVPEDLRKDPKAALTLIHYARDAGLHYQEVLQNAFVVKGKISFNTKFLIAQLRRRFSVQPVYEFTGTGDELVCTVRFHDLTRVDQNGDPLTMKAIEYSLSLKEGLQSSNGSDVWKKQPKKMLQYRTVKMAIDTHWPGILGFDSGEREEYIEWAEASSHVPSEGIRTVRIMEGNLPSNPRLEKLFGTVQGPVAEASIEPVKATPQTLESEADKLPELLFEQFRRALQAAKSLDTLKEIGRRIKVEESTGELMADEIDELRDLYRIRETELKGE